MSAAGSKTPGPWEAVDRRTVRSAYVMGDKSKVGWEVARLPEAALAGDAALIASAPDLLAALHDCREALRRAGAVGELRIVDAAIAKAEGRA